MPTELLDDTSERVLASSMPGRPGGSPDDDDADVPEDDEEDEGSPS